MTMTNKYRLVTRSDMDGLLAAVLFRDLDLINDIKFVHPKDVQDGVVELTDRDITTNLPYADHVHLSFDHHASEMIRIHQEKSNRVIDPNAPSTARLIYKYYGGKDRFPSISEEMLTAVDKADTADFAIDEVLNPTGWTLLSFVMDPRTGLGRFKEFRVSNYQLMMDLITYCKEHTIEEILDLPDIKERTDLYFEQQWGFREQLKRCSSVHDNLVVLDLRDELVLFVGNRFVVYALHPECNISMQVAWGLKRQNTMFAVGKSIFNRTSKVHIGEMMLEYGGGGHENAGTCQIENEQADIIKMELIDRLIDLG
ncbi:MAG: exopolyphosphatase [Armatimonadota bacterium]